MRIHVAFLLAVACTRPVAADEPNKPTLTPVRSLAFSPDGQLLAAAGSSGKANGHLVVWDTGSFQPRWRLSEKAGFPQIAFSPDGAILALSQFAPETKLLDAQTGAVVRELKGHTENARCVAFTPDGKRVITGSYDRTVKIWRTSSGELLQTLEGYGEPLYSVAVDPSGSTLAIAAAREGKVHLWDLSSNIQLHVFENLGSLVPHVSFSPDGKLLTIASWTESLTLYDTATLEMWLYVEPGGGVHWAEFSPDQRWLAVASNSLKIDVFPCNMKADEETRQRVNELLSRFQNDSYAIREQAMKDLEAIGPTAASQLRKAMTSPSAEVRWRSRKLFRRLGQPEAAVQLDGHRDEFDCVTFSPDSKLVAAGDKGGHVYVWRVGDWKQVVTLELK